MSGEASSLLGGAANIAKSDGPAGFFRGWGLNVVRLVPTFCVGASIYEQSRILFGLSYMK